MFPRGLIKLVVLPQRIHSGIFLFSGAFGRFFHDFPTNCTQTEGDFFSPTWTDLSQVRKLFSLYLLRDFIQRGRFSRCPALLIQQQKPEQRIVLFCTGYWSCRESRGKQPPINQHRKWMWWRSFFRWRWCRFESCCSLGTITLVKKKCWLRPLRSRNEIQKL